MDYTIVLEAESGILVCRMSGFLDETTARRFGVDFGAQIEAARAQRGLLRMLIDNRQGHVAAPAVAQALLVQMRGAKRPGDRSAIVVPNNLGKIQAKRVTTVDHEVFVSENAARTWLLAY